MRIGSLFAGVGGFDLGLERAGLGEVIWQVELSEFCRKILQKHWPNAARFVDIKDCGKHNLANVDLICGGFPCQDLSSAGHWNNKGLEGPKSSLWFEYARIVSELKPKIVIVENVENAKQRWLPEVRQALCELGYRTLAYKIAARDVQAPHLRKRVFVCGYANGYGEPVNAGHEKMAGLPHTTGKMWNGWETEPGTLRMAHGFSPEMDRVRALGNAVVPQVAELLGRHLLEVLPSKLLGV